MIQRASKKPGNIAPALRVTLLLVAGLVGIVTLIIVLTAVLGGLWLDNYLKTQPIITIIFVVISIPVSIISMLGIVRWAVSRFRLKEIEANEAHSKEGPFSGTN